MRVSSFYLNTLKEAPAEADVVSQQLMLRSGMTGPSSRPVSSGMKAFDILRAWARPDAIASGGAGDVGPLRSMRAPPLRLTRARRRRDTEPCSSARSPPCASPW